MFGRLMVKRCVMGRRMISTEDFRHYNIRIFSKELERQKDKITRDDHYELNKMLEKRIRHVKDFGMCAYFGFGALAVVVDSRFLILSLLMLPCAGVLSMRIEKVQKQLNMIKPHFF